MTADQSWRPTATFDVLRRRALMLETIRRYFAGRRIMEVDVPVLQRGANLDPNIVPLAIDTPEGRRWLPTSPEHPLKRLVAAGHGAVYTISPVFRAGERGVNHLPEFRMLEWYVPGWDEIRLAEQVLEIFAIATGLGTRSERMPWAESYRRHASVDPDTADDAALHAAAPDAPAGLDRSGLLDFLMATRVVPELGRGQWTVLTEWPVEAAAQALIRHRPGGRSIAARFEIYRDGIELANGYAELTDGAELRRRLEAERAKRPDATDLALDERFLMAMAHGLPTCAGVAVGLDRLTMVAQRLGSVAEAVAFADG